MENLDKLVSELMKQKKETQWLEFKHNNYDPAMIGKDICALANSAALYEKNCAYMVWGIDDNTHEIVGTDYDLQTLKKGNQELENWLRAMLSPNSDFEFHSLNFEGKSIGVLIIRKAVNQPVTFEKVEYIRVGSYTKKLADTPALQAQLWDKIRNSKFEERIALQDLEMHEALQLLEYNVYFDMLNMPQPCDSVAVSHYLLEDGIIVRQDNGLYAITNLGAIAFAKRLTDFPRLSRKAVRIVEYADNSRMDIIREDIGTKGYIADFRRLLDIVRTILPSQEIINGAIREKVDAYPMIAVREAIANALIHQDFALTGTGPIIEIFTNRIEITNPGVMLVDVNRIIDNPPRSRNEKLAALMRRMGMCEELGSGWDKIILACEAMLLPAPRIVLYEENTRVIIFSNVSFRNLFLEDKLWSCYLHACIKQVQGEQLTNTSLRTRFGLKTASSGTISRLIKEAVNKNYIKPLDPSTAPRYMKYIPIWA